MRAGRGRGKTVARAGHLPAILVCELAGRATGGRGTRKGEERRANSGGVGVGVGVDVGGVGRGDRGGGNRRGRGASSARGEIWDSSLMFMTFCHQLTRK
jgi:hypothetical protein